MDGCLNDERLPEGEAFGRIDGGGGRAGEAARQGRWERRFGSGIIRSTDLARTIDGRIILWAFSSEEQHT